MLSSTTGYSCRVLLLWGRFTPTEEIEPDQVKSLSQKKEDRQ